MSHTFITMLAAYGICFGLMNDKASFLTGFLRRIPIGMDSQGLNVFSRMLSCPYCTGFHAGYMAWFLTNWSDLAKAPSWNMLSEAVLVAFASSALCYLADISAEWLESWGKES
jgi:threonine/homoserine efflux transporter RhtA